MLVALPLRVHATAGPGKITGPSTAATPGDAQICATEGVQNEVKAKRWTEGGGAPTLPSHPADRASVALAAAVGGAAFGRTRSLAISQRGHGHHLLQQNLKEVRQLRARAQDLAGEASCVRSLCSFLSRLPPYFSGNSAKWKQALPKGHAPHGWCRSSQGHRPFWECCRPLACHPAHWWGEWG